MNERDKNARGKSEGLACDGVVVHLWRERFIGVTALVLSATVHICTVYVNLDFFCNYLSR